jgi:nicotinamide-nucleotide amidase
MKPLLRTAAILSTGDEVVGGRTLDTNSSWLAAHLVDAGLEVVSMVTVGDYVERILGSWQALLGQADLVISTGGIGPTSDDLTNETVAQLIGAELVLNQVEADHIRQIFASHDRVMPENNLKQALLPPGAEVVTNALGTAPGYRLVIPQGDRSPVAVVLPGVPREMKAMFEDQVLPWINGLIPEDNRVVARTFQTFGLPESALDEALDGAFDADIRVAFRASFPKIALRLSANGANTEERLDRAEAIVHERLGGVVYAQGEAEMEDVVGRLLSERGMTLATAESCTGGLIGSRITDVAGSSQYYVGGLVAYSNQLKQQLLGVAEQTLELHGAVSEETAVEMAEGACVRTGADMAVATTGIAGPGGGTEAKPVGTVALALAQRTENGFETRSAMYHLWGTREWIKMLTSQLALDWVRCRLLGQEPLDSGFGSSIRPKAAE